MNALKTLYIFFIIISFCIAYQDWSTHKFSPIFLLWLYVFSLFLFWKDFFLVKNFILSGSIGCGVPFLLRKFLKKPSLGSGDLHLLAISGLWVPWDCWPSIFVFIGMGGTLWGLVYRGFGQSTFPFTPLIIAAILPYLYSYCWKPV